MFSYSNTFSSFSTDSIKKVKAFYAETLGLDITEDEMGILTLHLKDDSNAIIYPKGKQHQPASFTVLNFRVDDIDETVDQLTNSGVRFEQYSGEIETDEKGVFRGDGPQIAWFKDPAGNILSVIQIES